MKLDIERKVFSIVKVSKD